MNNQTEVQVDDIQLDDMLNFVRYVNEKILPIDEFKLEEECRNQASFYEEVGVKAAKARAVSKRARDQLEYTKVQIEKDIRTSPEKFGIFKVTEGAIASAVLLAVEVQEGLKHFREKEDIADVLSILQSSVEQRKSALRDLVNLFIHSYYSEIDGKPVSTRETQAIREGQIREARENKHRDLEG